jgi:GWxTD domain-containing protein
MRLKPVICLLVFLATLWSQPGYQGPARDNDKSGIQPVRIRPFPVLKTDNEYRVYLLVELMYDVLQFTFNNEYYRANFETELIFIDNKTQAKYSQIWASDFRLSDFEITNSRQNYYLTLDSLDLPPSEYNVSFRYQDLQGKQKIPFEFKFHLPQKKNITTTSPLFVDLNTYMNFSIPDLKYRPLATFSQIPFNKKIGLFFTAHAENTDTLTLSISLLKPDSREQLFLLDTLLTSRTSWFTGILKPPFLELEEGNYQIKLIFKSDSDSSLVQTPLKIRWPDKPRSLRTLEYAMQPLQIITSKEEYDGISSGSKKEKAAKFMNFWKEKDPTPQTAFNELLYEFYSRVDSVDWEFGGKTRRYGWRTDPGKIILLYGDPDIVEDQSLNPVKPYLSWSYILPDTTLTFIFRAIDGRKQYRLIQEQETLN